MTPCHSACTAFRRDSFISLLSVRAQRVKGAHPLQSMSRVERGDIALCILDHARETCGDRETRVDVVDINGEMLKEGHIRFKKAMYHNSPRAAL